MMKCNRFVSMYGLLNTPQRCSECEPDDAEFAAMEFADLIARHGYFPPHDESFRNAQLQKDLNFAKNLLRLKLESA